LSVQHFDRDGALQSSMTTEIDLGETPARQEKLHVDLAKRAPNPTSHAADYTRQICSDFTSGSWRTEGAGVRSTFDTAFGGEGTRMQRAANPGTLSNHVE
jgi:hypothetical protein